MNGDEPHFEHRIKLGFWESTNVASEAPAAPVEGPAVDPDAPVPNVDDMSRIRDLGIRFYGLTFSQKSAIAGRLELLDDADMAQPDFERFRRVFFRASERHKLAELQQAIEEIERRSNR